jgi:hypothetical protein
LVTSIRRHAHQFTRRDRPHLWSIVVAVMLNAASFAGVMGSLRPVVASVDARSPYAPPPTSERIVFVMPRTASVASTLRNAPTPAAPAAPPATPEVVQSVPPAPDSGSALPASPGATPNVAELRSPLDVPVPSARLLAPGSGNSSSPFAARSAHDPFAPATLPSRAERDSTLAALGESFAQLVARRVPTRSERDSNAKEAMLKMRNSGRTLLVPPDNSGGLITARIPLPFLGSARSRSRRAGDRAAHDENRARLERVRQRADSMRRAREDSLRN